MPQFSYAGMFYHPPSGLYLTHYRAYDAFTGRWINQDPIGESGGINLYAYVGGSPINEADQQGLMGRAPGGFAPPTPEPPDVGNIGNMRNFFNGGIDQINRNGWRLDCDGVFCGILNNDRQYFTDHVMVCFDQASCILGMMEGNGFKNDWDFNMVGVGGGEDGDGHYIVEAIPKNHPNWPYVYMDPWRGTFVKKTIRMPGKPVPQDQMDTNCPYMPK